MPKIKNNAKHSVHGTVAKALILQPLGCDSGIRFQSAIHA
jgi:hypothetical protein